MKKGHHLTFIKWWPGMATVDNNDTVLYGCIRVALELQPSEENATLMKSVRQLEFTLQLGLQRM